MISPTLSRSIPPWYSCYQLAIGIFIVFSIVLLISRIIPPFQSPDEFNHFKRAYLLSRGQVVLLDQQDGFTGGEIDTGLLAYMDAFAAVSDGYENKVTKDAVEKSRKILWTNKRIFSPLPNAASYFPLLYIPQALSCWIGQALGLSVASTYYVGRISSSAATLLLLFWAARIFSLPPLVMAIFLTPMTLFQLSSTSLDPITFGLATLAAALFCRGVSCCSLFPGWMQLLLLASLALLGMSRTQLIPLTSLPFAIFFVRRLKRYWIYSAVGLLLSVGWLLFTLLTVKGYIGVEGQTPTQIAKFYATRPITLIRVLISTLTDGGLLTEYWKGFVGVLGWSDTPLDAGVYIAFGVLYLSLVLISVKRPSAICFGGKYMIACVALSTLFLFLIFLVSFTPQPAVVVQWVQSRYFTALVIFLAFPLFNRNLSTIARKRAFVLLAVTAAVSVWSMYPKLLARYWL